MPQWPFKSLLNTDDAKLPRHTSMHMESEFRTNVC